MTVSFATAMRAGLFVAAFALLPQHAAQAADAGAPPSIVVPETPAGTTAATSGGTATPGCNPVVDEAARRAAEVQNAFAAAARDEVDTQNPSVLQMTCFNQSAGMAATQGGFFSGEFMSQADPIVGSALNSFYDDFQGALTDLFGGSVGSEIGGVLQGALGGLFGGGASTLQGTYDCDGMAQTREAVRSRGVVTGVSAPSFADMMQGKAPAGAGDKFKKSLQASEKNHVFSNAKKAMEALPKAKVTSYSNTMSLCETLKAAGQNPENCKNAK